MKKISTVLFLCIAMSILTAQSENAVKTGKSYVLSVEDAVKLADENNISIQRSQITLNAALRTKEHSWNSISPSMSIGASASVPLDSLTSGDQETDYDASLGVSATLSLNLTANLYSSMQGAKLSYEQQKISFSDAVRSIELAVRQTFYSLIYEKENIKLQTENLNIAKTQYESNLAKYNSGRLSEVDALSAEVNYKSKIPTVENAVTTYQNDLAAFKQVLGLEQEDEVSLSGSLSDVLYLGTIKLPEGELSSSAIKNLKLKIASAKNSVLEKKFSAYAPSLNASASLREQSWYLNGEGRYEDAEPSKSASLTLSATIPLDGYLPWSSKNDAVDSAKDSVSDLELQLESARTDLKRTVDSSLRSISQSQSSIKYKQANVALAQKTYEMTNEAYNRGTKDLLTLQNANNTLLSAQVSLNSEILTLTKSILNLENTIGAEFGSLTK